MSRVAELYAVVEAFIPVVETEVECLTDFVQQFPTDEDHAEDVERLRVIEDALKKAKALLARRPTPRTGEINCCRSGICSKPILAKGLCRLHYHQDYHKRRKEGATA